MGTLCNYRELLRFSPFNWCFFFRKDLSDHGLLESRTGNFNITIKNEKTYALISERIDEITYFFFKERCPIQLSM